MFRELKPNNSSSRSYTHKRNPKNKHKHQNSREPRSKLNSVGKGSRKHRNRDVPKE